MTSVKTITPPPQVCKAASITYTCADVVRGSPTAERQTQRMEVRPQRIFSWWIIFIIYLHALAEVRLVKSQNSRSENGRKPTRTQNYIRFQESTVSKQLQSAELSTRLRPITVKCHPDSLEVVVQADLFETGIQIDGQHLRLGLGLDPVSGSSSCTAVPSGEAEFTIRARLTDCGTKLSVSRWLRRGICIYSI